MAMSERPAADIREQRRIWESRCPALLAERDRLTEALERMVALLDQAVAALDIATAAIEAGSKMPDRAVLTAKLATATKELRVAVGEAIGGNDAT